MRTTFTLTPPRRVRTSRREDPVPVPALEIPDGVISSLVWRRSSRPVRARWVTADTEYRSRRIPEICASPPQPGHRGVPFAAGLGVQGRGEDVPSAPTTSLQVSLKCDPDPESLPSPASTPTPPTAHTPHAPDHPPAPPLTTRPLVAPTPLATAGGRGYHRPVPIYEFVCERCDGRFEDLVEAGAQAAHARAAGWRGPPGSTPRRARRSSWSRRRRERRRQERQNAQLHEGAKQPGGAELRAGTGGEKGEGD